MYSLSEQLLEQYPFTVSDIQKGRGAYICATEEGKKIIKVYDASEIRAEALSRFLNEARSSGILTDRIIRTKENTILASDVDETTYYARDYIEGSECETKGREDLLSASTALARFHKSIRVQAKQMPDGMVVRPDMLLSEYEKHNRELKKVRNYIRGKKSKNEFEMIFMKNYDVFSKNAERAVEKLKSQMNESSQGDWEQAAGICHGDFNQHNVLFAKDGIWITNFENAVYDVYIRDMANFLRKIMEKHNWNIGLAVDMIGAYEKVRRLSPLEMEQLYVRLCYPEKFWKIANHYYNSNKAWISGRNIEKLNKVIEQEEQREQFLRILEFPRYLK